jgi:DNA-directed RNA polymerase subunit RPC12/RpoP
MTDVTDKVDFNNPDDEYLPLTRCVCGATFPSWDQVLSIYPEHPWECPACGAKLVFRNAVRVFQVT